MRRLILLTALALVVPVAAQAQDDTPAKGSRARMLSTVDFLMEQKAELKPTADQASKLEQISRKYAAETAPLRANMQKVHEEMSMGAAKRELMMQKMRPIRAELRQKDDAAVAEIMAVLNDQQKQTAKSLIEARRGKMRDRPGGRQRPVKTM